MANKRQSRCGHDSKIGALIADHAVAIADYAAQALVAAEQLRIKGKSVGSLPLGEAQREAVFALGGLQPRLKKKLGKPDATFTVAEVAAMALTVAESLADAEPIQQIVLLTAAVSLMNMLNRAIVGSEAPAANRKPKAADLLFQFAGPSAPRGRPFRRGQVGRLVINDQRRPDLIVQDGGKRPATLRAASAGSINH